MENFKTHSVITKEDYLQYYMHTIATTPAFKKQRRRLQIILYIFVLSAALWSIYNGTLNGSPWVIILVWVIVFPLMYFLFKYLEKRKYTRFFRKYIATNHQENMEKGHDLSFGNDGLTIQFADHELKMPYNDLAEIYRNQNGIYIKNKNGSSFIFPSRDVDYLKIKSNWEEVAGKFNVLYQQEEQWVWK